MDVFEEDSCGGKYNWRINDVLIGAGSMGRIYKVFCSKAVKNFALKVIQLRDGSFEGDEAKQAITEMLILRRLRKQPGVIQLYDAFALEKESCKKERERELLCLIDVLLISYVILYWMKQLKQSFSCWNIVRAIS